MDCVNCSRLILFEAGVVLFHGIAILELRLIVGLTALHAIETVFV